MTSLRRRRTGLPVAAFLALAATVGPAVVGPAAARGAYNYYYYLIELFEALPTAEHNIYFVGDSLTARHPLAETLANPDVRNRGIPGETARGLYNHLDRVIHGSPKKLFVMIGINDLVGQTAKEDVAAIQKYIVRHIRETLPETQIYLQSLLPINPRLFRETRGAGWANLPLPTAQDIGWINGQLQALAYRTENTVFIDLAPHFADGDGNLRADLTDDGIHLVADGMWRWADLIRHYVNG